MIDRFDEELRQAIKESTAGALEGWEFTPAMREAVMNRIAAAESSPAQAAPPSKARPRRSRPLLWATAAAAVLLLSLNMGRMMNKTSGPLPAAESPAGTDIALMAAPEAVTMDSRALTAQDAAEAANALESASQAADSVSPPEGEVDLGVTGEPVFTPRLHAEGALSAERIRLVPPEAVAERQTFGIFAVPRRGNVALEEAPGDAVAVLTTETVQLADAAGGLLWEQPVPEAPHAVAAAADGRIAVAAGEEVHIFDQSGETVANLELSAPAGDMEFSPDGRLAVHAGDRVRMYHGEPGAVVLYDRALPNAELAFSADGTLAVLARDGDDHWVELISQEGLPLVKEKVAGQSEALAFIGDGEYFLAGGEVFHRSGRLAWQLPFAASGAAALGGDLLAWNEAQVSLLRAADGMELWTAEHEGGRILEVAAGGDRVAILGAGETGIAVWVLDSEGRALFSEALAGRPLDMAVAADRLSLLMPEGLEVREIAP